MRVHYYVHGRGRGHATRSLVILERLETEGFHGTVFAGDDARAPLEAALERSNAWKCVPIRSLPPQTSASAIALGARRVAHAIQTIGADRPDLVISDGDHPSVLAARARGRPVIAVGHGLVFSECRRPPYLPSAPWRREALKASLSSWPANVHVPVNFVPLETKRPSTRLARPALRLGPLLGNAPAEASTVLSYFAQGEGELTLAERVVPALRRQLDPELRLVLFGTFEHPGVETRPPDRAAFLAELMKCRAVVASAGSQLISECVALGRPIFAVFDPNHDEMRLNVGMLTAHGLGDGCPADALDEARLARFLAASPSRLAPPAWNAPDAAETVLSCARELAS